MPRRQPFDVDVVLHCDGHAGQRSVSPRRIRVDGARVGENALAIDHLEGTERAVQPLDPRKVRESDLLGAHLAAPHQLGNRQCSARRQLLVARRDHAATT